MTQKTVNSCALLPFCLQARCHMDFETAAFSRGFLSLLLLFYFIFKPSWTVERDLLFFFFWFSFLFFSFPLGFFCRLFGEKGRNSARDRRRERLVPDVQQRFIPTVYRPPHAFNFFLGFFCYFNKNVALEPGPPRSWEPLLAHGEGLGFGIWDFSPKIPPVLGSWWG